MSTVLVFLAIASSVVTVVGGVLAIHRHFRPNRLPQILSPPTGSENGGRCLAVSGIIPLPESRSTYWIAVQGSDCREQDWWWPQRSQLTLGRKGAWTVHGVTLGRELANGGSDDIGKGFTIALFEVPGDLKDLLKDDVCITKPARCCILCSIDVTRVRCEQRRCLATAPKRCDLLTCDTFDVARPPR